MFSSFLSLTKLASFPFFCVFLILSILRFYALLMAFVFQAVRILIYVASGNLPIVCGREMASAGLSGTISSGIGNLSHLQTL